MAEWLRGRLTEAERAFASSVTVWRETGQPAITAWGYYSLALIRRAQGPLGRGRPDLSAGHAQPGHRRPAAASRRTGLRWPGRDRPPAGRTRPRAAARDRGHRAVPPVPSTPPLADALEAITAANRAHQARRACSTRSPPSGPGCCWPTVTWPPRPVSRKTTASARTTSRTTHASPTTWSWPGSCSPRTARAGARAAGPAARGGRRPGPSGRPDRDGRAAGAGPGRHRRRNRRGHRPGRGAPAGFARRATCGRHRRGPADGHAARSGDRRAARRPGGRRRPARLPGPAAAFLRHRACRAQTRPKHRLARHRRPG